MRKQPRPIPQQKEPGPIRADGHEGLPLSYIRDLIEEVLVTAVQLRDPQTADVLEKNVYATILCEIACGHPQAQEMAGLIRGLASCHFPRLVDQLLNLSEETRTALFYLLDNDPKRLDRIIASQLFS